MELQRRLRDGDSVLVEIGGERLELQVIADRSGRPRLILRSDAPLKLSVFHSRREPDRDSP